MAYVYRRTIEIECPLLDHLVKISPPGFIPTTSHHVVFVDAQKFLEHWRKTDSTFPDLDEDGYPKIGTIRRLQADVDLQNSAAAPIMMTQVFIPTSGTTDIKIYNLSC